MFELEKSELSHKHILTQAEQLKPLLIEMRRHIHANPELSFEEHATAEYVQKKLLALGYQVKPNIGGTGVLAEIGEGEKIVGIRADMDALPISEKNPAEYCSTKEQVMHACGHDAHTAAALGAANLLARLNEQNKLPTRFRFIFQPAEEACNDDGLSGASMMMKDGCLDKLSSLVAIHVHPGMPTGTLGFKSGTFLAACDSFHITLKGRGGHGGYPENTVDAIVLASNLIQSLQTIISRRKSALSPAVLTIGGIKSNTFRPNIVAEEVEMVGTIRYFDEHLSQFFENEILNANKMLEPWGASLTLKYFRENPPLHNDEKLTSRLHETANALLGQDKVLSLPLELGAEDFSFYTKHIPSVFAIVGCGIEGSPREIHTSTFDIDENALVYGTAFLTAAALDMANDN